MTNKRLYEIINDREQCEFYPDCEDDTVCFKCERVTPIAAYELREYYSRLRELAASLTPARPLTLEQLRAMDMQVVWVSDLLLPACSDFHLVVRINGETRLFGREAVEGKHVGYSATTGHNYGKTWTAYASRPKEGENVILE